MRNTGPVKSENDLRKKLLSRFQKMKKTPCPIFKTRKKLLVPFMVRNSIYKLLKVFCNRYQILAISRMRYHVVIHSIKQQTWTKTGLSLSKGFSNEMLVGFLSFQREWIFFQDLDIQRQ